MNAGSLICIPSWNLNQTMWKHAIVIRGVHVILTGFL